MQTKAGLILVGIHVFVWGLQFFAVSLAGGSYDCNPRMAGVQEFTGSQWACGTPIIGLFDVGGIEPSFAGLGRVIQFAVFDFISLLWGLFWVNYAILNAEGAWGLIGFVLKAGGMIAALAFFGSMLGNLLQSRF